jgi:hypothetical protein
MPTSLRLLCTTSSDHQRGYGCPRRVSNWWAPSLFPAFANLPAFMYQKRGMSLPLPERVTPASQRALQALEVIDSKSDGSRTCKPNSVCWIAPAGRSFLWATHYCGAQATYPEVVTRRAGTYPEPKSRTPPLFGLAPCGVCPARPITATAVRSYRTFSPLPGRRRPGGIFSVVLSVDWA